MLGNGVELAIATSAIRSPCAAMEVWKEYPRVSNTAQVEYAPA